MSGSVKIVRVMVDFENQVTEHVVRYTKVTPFGEFEEDTTVRIDDTACLDAALVGKRMAAKMADGNRVGAKKPQLTTVELPGVPAVTVSPTDPVIP